MQFDIGDTSGLFDPGATLRLVVASADGDVNASDGRTVADLQGSPLRQQVTANVTPQCTSLTRPFTVNGTMLFDGGPWPVGDMEVVITPLALNQLNANTDPPWTDLGAITATVTVNEVDGTWTWSGNIPIGTTVVNVDEHPFGNVSGYRRAYLLPAGTRWPRWLSVTTSVAHRRRSPIASSVGRPASHPR